MLDNNCFSKERKLTNKHQFKRTFDNRKRISDKYYSLYFIHNNLEFPRIGVITSKKNARFAVARNKIRRQAREAFRLEQSSLPHVDMVFVAHRSAANAAKSELRLCLKKLFTKLQRDCKSS